MNAIIGRAPENRNKMPVAGLGPAIHVSVCERARPRSYSPVPDGWLYIMTNRPHGTLYVGATTGIAKRAWEHRESVADGFTERYGLTRLVYVEAYADILTVKQRERNMKHWPRAWKVHLVLRDNPAWDDLYDRLARGRGWPGQARPRAIKSEDDNRSSVSASHCIFTKRSWK
jgi:putative endonuclease